MRGLVAGGDAWGKNRRRARATAAAAAVASAAAATAAAVAAATDANADAATAAAELAAWERIDTVLGVGKAEEEAPVELTALLEERAEARKAKDFARADAIRDELTKEGWTIEDTPKGARLKRG